MLIPFTISVRKLKDPRKGRLEVRSIITGLHCRVMLADHTLALSELTFE